MNENIKRRGKKVVRKIFETSQKLRLTVLPFNFYSPLPEISYLKTSDDWKQPRRSLNLINGAADVDSQVIFLKSLYKIPNKPDGEKLIKEARLINNEPKGYGEIESDILYSFICTNKPKRVIQIGCGVSTHIILEAAKFIGYKPQIICIDPYPTTQLLNLEKSGDIELIVSRTINMSPDTFDVLQDNDFLFIDSTHTVKVASEVNYLVMDVLPYLNAGVWVHFHDINFPYDYYRDVLNDDLHFWSENSLVYAYLLSNEKYTVKMSQSMLHYFSPETIKECISWYNPQGNKLGLRIGDARGKHAPSSLYIRAVK